MNTSSWYLAVAAVALLALPGCGSSRKTTPQRVVEYEQTVVIEEEFPTLPTK